jgi:hypothetical protein
MRWHARALTTTVKAAPQTHTLRAQLSFDTQKPRRVSAQIFCISAQISARASLFVLGRTNNAITTLYRVLSRRGEKLLLRKWVTLTEHFIISTENLHDSAFK